MQGTSLRPIFDLLDYRLIPPDGPRIARMLADGRERDEIALRLGQPIDAITDRAGVLRKVMLDQVLPRAGELDHATQSEFTRLLKALDGLAAANGAH